MAVEKPLNFSVQITAEWDALKVSLKVTVSFTREGSSDLQTCYTVTDRFKQRGRKMDDLTFSESKLSCCGDLKSLLCPVLHPRSIQSLLKNIFFYICLLRGNVGEHDF